jgi:hypothetical protein
VDFEPLSIAVPLSEDPPGVFRVGNSRVLLEAAAWPDKGRTRRSRQDQGPDSVIAFLVDQNFNEHIVDGLTRRDPALEFTHVRDVGLAAAPDPAVLDWAGGNGRVLLTHDRGTIPAFAYERVAAGLSIAWRRTASVIAFTLSLNLRTFPLSLPGQIDAGIALGRKRGPVALSAGIRCR